MVILSSFDNAIVAPLLVGVILLLVHHWLNDHK
ncbi:type I toxin-antitoxin system Fst family toxin [Lacticaseibacillus zhaodongensis]